MSHDRSGPTRRGFLGTATVATAATMAIPHASQAQTPSGPFVLTKSDPAETGTAATSPPARPRDWTQPASMAIPKEGYFKYEQGRYGPVFQERPPITASLLSRGSSRGQKRRSAGTAKPSRMPLPAIQPSWRR